MMDRLLTAPLIAVALVATPLPLAHAQPAPIAAFTSFDGVDFGDDAGEFTHDGECDDLRFTGDGMTQTPLMPDDIFRDASDCRTAFRTGKVTLAPMFIRLSGEREIDWGDDSSEFARDGECDDLRFEGPGLTETPLLADDIGHDASDCRVAYKKGKILWRTGAITPLATPSVIA